MNKAKRVLRTPRTNMSKFQDTRSQLLALAVRYCEATKLSLGDVSVVVFNDRDQLARVRDGAMVDKARHDAAMRWFSKNWPPRVKDRNAGPSE